MNLDKKRWIILLAGCFINLCLGSIYAWSIFSSAMADYFNGKVDEQKAWDNFYMSVTERYPNLKK